MIITALKLYPVQPRWLFLKIETDEGICGWGEPVVEGHAHTVKAAVEEMSCYLLGKDPRKIEDLWQTMYRTGFYRGGPVMMSAIAGSMKPSLPNTVRQSAAQPRPVRAGRWSLASSH